MTDAEIDHEWRSFRLLLDDQPRSVSLIDGYRTWSAIDESERTHWRVKAARLPSEGK